ncbi:MAG: CDC27 family protein [Acidiferrobacterales bacterium]|nr:CDC27 family protein [Acidiferrobacterales bacterium]
MKHVIRKRVGFTLSTPVIAFFMSLALSQFAYAQEDDAPQRSTKRVQSIPQALVKDFEKVNEMFEAENYGEAERILNTLRAKPDLNNISKAYINNYSGNIKFSRDDLRGALNDFRAILADPEGIPEGFYNQIIYVVAQVYFSQENYREALNYAKRWFQTQADPTADAYMLIGQAHYMLKEYDAALPNVQSGIQKYVDLGETPKEGWLNLLSSIYRNKNDFRKMLPVVKQLVTHYPKKDYLLTMAGVYNELDDQPKMTAMYQAMYDQNLLTAAQSKTLAQLQMSEDNPYQAAAIMEKLLNAGSIDKDLNNYRIYSQALYLAKEYERALAPLAQAARLAGDGEIYNQLGQSYIALNKWSEAETALGNALQKGGLKDTGAVLISQGLARFEQKKYESAKAAFNRALQYGKSAEAASNWIKYVDNEVYRLQELAKPVEIDVSV